MALTGTIGTTVIENANVRFGTTALSNEYRSYAAKGEFIMDKVSGELFIRRTDGKVISYHQNHKFIHDQILELRVLLVNNEEFTYPNSDNSFLVISDYDLQAIDNDSTSNLNVLTTDFNAIDNNSDDSVKRLEFDLSSDTNGFLIKLGCRDCDRGVIECLTSKYNSAVSSFTGSTATAIWNYTTGGNTLFSSVTSVDTWSSAGSYPITYNGTIYTNAVSTNSSSSFVFNAPRDGKLTVISYSSNTSPTININGAAKSISANGAVTLNISAGETTITQGTSNTYLYAFIYEYAVDSSGYDTEKNKFDDPTWYDSNATVNYTITLTDSSGNTTETTENANVRINELNLVWMPSWYLESSTKYESIHIKVNSISYDKLQFMYEHASDFPELALSVQKLLYIDNRAIVNTVSIERFIDDLSEATILGNETLIQLIDSVHINRYMSRLNKLMDSSDFIVSATEPASSEWTANTAWAERLRTISSDGVHTTASTFDINDFEEYLRDKG